MSLRQIIDVREIKTVALPAAAATAYTASINVGSGPHIERMELRLSLPATPSLVDAKTVTCAIQDSADDVTYADVAALGTLVVTGAGGAGAAAQDLDLRLPSSIKPYVRARATVLAAGGSNIAVSLSLIPLF